MIVVLVMTASAIAGWLAGTIWARRGAPRPTRRAAETGARPAGRAVEALADEESVAFRVDPDRTLTLSPAAASMFGLTGRPPRTLAELAAAGPAGDEIALRIEQFFQTGKRFCLTVALKNGRAVEVRGEARGFSALVTLTGS